MRPPGNPVRFSVADEAVGDGGALEQRRQHLGQHALDHQSVTPGGVGDEVMDGLVATQGSGACGGDSSKPAIAKLTLC